MGSTQKWFVKRELYHSHKFSLYKIHVTIHDTLCNKCLVSSLMIGINLAIELIVSTDNRTIDDFSRLAKVTEWPPKVVSPFDKMLVDIKENQNKPDNERDDETILRHRDNGDC